MRRRRSGRTSRRGWRVRRRGRRRSSRRLSRQNPSSSASSMRLEGGDSLSSPAVLLAAKSSSSPPFFCFFDLFAPALPFPFVNDLPLVAAFLRGLTSSTRTRSHQPHPYARKKKARDAPSSSSSESTTTPFPPFTPRPSEGLFLLAAETASSESEPEPLASLTAVEDGGRGDLGFGAGAGRLEGTCAYTASRSISSRIALKRFGSAGSERKTHLDLRLLLVRFRLNIAALKRDDLTLLHRHRLGLCERLTRSSGRRGSEVRRGGRGGRGFGEEAEEGGLRAAAAAD
ncbi:hypothetical protein BJY59DRAFT_70854 [Rhodotorula toruloides]